MALTKEFEYDCEVRGEHKHVQVRKATIVKDDGAEISRSYHRHVLHCRTKDGDTWGDTDISGEDASAYKQCATQFGLAMLSLPTKLQWMHKKRRKE